jgi:hypothetical protein
MLSVILIRAGTGHGLKLDFSLRTQFNITRRLLRDKSEILIVCLLLKAFLVLDLFSHGTRKFSPFF